MGVASVFGEEHIMERIYSDIRAGLSLECAAQRAGVSHETLKNWIRRGRRGDELYVAFYQESRRALADAQALYVARINIASKDDWKAAAWMLERMWPETYGDNKKELREALKLLKQLQRENIKTPIASQEAIQSSKPDDSSGSNVKLEAISGGTDSSPELPG